jgi:hypothetical protein
VLGDPELEGIGDPEIEEEGETEFDTLVEVDPEYDAELDTLGVSELDEIHEAVFREDTEATCVIELLKVSEILDDPEWDDDRVNRGDIV